MTVIERMSTRCEVKDPLLRVVTHLAQYEYQPLIAQAKQQFTSVFGEHKPIETFLKQDGGDTSRLTYERAFRQRLFNSTGLLDFQEGFGTLLGGDLFLSPQEYGLLYVVVRSELDQPSEVQDGKKTDRNLTVEIGYIGHKNEIRSLDNFATLTAEALSHRNRTVEWRPVQLSNPDFNRLREDSEVVSAALSDDDIDLSAKLEDQTARDVAIGIKRAGSVLAKDLSQKISKNRKRAQRGATELVKAKLLSSDFVVICRKNSHQINRVESHEAIERMNELGVRCSCGRPIAEERVEELYSPTAALYTMLNQSYWMTARLVNALRHQGISEDRILLNLRHGPEEIDAFVDVDGALFMFELKDSTFSMGHAYAFSSRIAIYKPDYAVIVATGGVSPEVKSYFDVAEPSANIVYVDQLDKLHSVLRRTLDKLDYHQALQILLAFEPMATYNVPISSVLAKRVGVPNDLVKELP